MKNKQKLSIIKLNLLQRRNMYAFLFILLLYECVDYVIIQKIYKKKKIKSTLFPKRPQLNKKKERKKNKLALILLVNPDHSPPTLLLLYI